MSTQQTLTLEDAEQEREKPDTFRWCHHCEEFVLRSRWKPHDEHDWQAQEETEPDSNEDKEDDENDEPEKVGAYYDVKLSYSVDYRFRVPAWTEHEAEEIAKELKLDAHPADAHHVHTDRREVKELTTEDVPDDFDPYGNERLIDAIDRMGKNE